MPTKKELDTIGFILGSEYRQKIIFILKEGMKTPKQLSEETNIQINHVSNILKELSDKNLVECKTPNRRKGRLYSITEKGKVIVKKIKEI